MSIPGIKTKIVDYFRPQKDVVAVYLFGSYAAKKNRPFSDIDIGILFDDMAVDSMVEKETGVYWNWEEV